MNAELTPRAGRQAGTLRAIALLLAFVPSALFLTFATMRSRPSVWLFSGITLVSIACCVTSSLILFKRKTKASIIVGIIFLLVNASVVFFLGCSAWIMGILSK
jgi:hypothetical protein